MDSKKYIGLDVHQATIVVAVMDSARFSRLRHPPVLPRYRVPQRAVLVRRA